MQKDNICRSSEFHMDEGDVLHLRFLDETFQPIEFMLASSGDNDNIDEVPDAPTALAASDITDSSFYANWNYQENTLGFYLDVSTASDFSSFVVGYEDLDVGLVNEYSVVGLGDAIPYYYRLRAYNDIGTSVNSNIITLTTACEVITDFDGNVYTYVTIGTQQWLVENLQTTHYNDGTAIPNLTLNADWIAEDGTPGHDGAYCWYDNDAVTYADYGCLYNWYAVDNAHGFAVVGWRIPTNADMTTLSDYLGGLLGTGGELKETGTVHWNSPNTGATNETGFTALPGGLRAVAGAFSNIGVSGHWWSSTEVDAGNAWLRYLTAPDDDIIVNSVAKYAGYSVKCMRDV